MLLRSITAVMSLSFKVRHLFRKNLIQKRLRQRFHVTPKVGNQFSGVLLAEDRHYAVFADVIAYPDEADPEKVAGDLYVPADNIAYSQLVPC
jgi:hypothetical protein